MERPSRRTSRLRQIVFVAIACWASQAALAAQPIAMAITSSSQDTSAQRQAMIDEMKAKLAEFSATGNADFDFAAFMQLCDEAIAKMAKAELDHGADRRMRNLARQRLGTTLKERVRLKQWMEQFDRYD